MKKLVYLGFGLALTVAGMVSAARPAQAASSCTTYCSPEHCCFSCCIINGTRHCTSPAC
jgi:hypothetical protein